MKGRKYYQEMVISKYHAFTLRRPWGWQRYSWALVKSLRRNTNWPDEAGTNWAARAKSTSLTNVADYVERPRDVNVLPAIPTIALAQPAIQCSALSVAIEATRQREPVENCRRSPECVKVFRRVTMSEEPMHLTNCRLPLKDQSLNRNTCSYMVN